MTVGSFATSEGNQTGEHFESGGEAEIREEAQATEAGKAAQGRPKRGLPSFILLTKGAREVLGQHSEIWPDDFSELEAR